MPATLRDIMLQCRQLMEEVEELDDKLFTKEMQRKFNNTKLLLIIELLKGSDREEVKTCLVDLVEDVWSGDLEDEDIKRRYRQCLTV